MDQEIETIFKQVNDEFNFSYNISFNVEEEHPAAIILDLDNPNVLGEKKIKLFLENNSEIPIVYLKTQFQLEEVRRLFKLGAADCLTKPITKESIYYVFHEIKKKLEERKQLLENKAEKEKVKNLLKTSLAYDLIFGNLKNSKEVWDRCKLCGINSLPNTAMVVHIDQFKKLTQNKSKLWEQSIRNEIINAIQKFQQGKLEQILILVTAVDKIVVLLSIPLQKNKKEYRKIAENYAKELRGYITENTNYTVSIGIGNYYEDPRNLYISYHEALHAETYKFFLGENIVIHVEDTKPFENVSGIIPNDRIASLGNSLKIGDFIGVKENVSSLLDAMCEQCNVKPQTLKLQVLDLLTTLARSAIEGGARPKEIYKIHSKFVNEIYTIESIQQLKQWFQDVTENFLELVLENYNEQILNSVQKAITYINNNYNHNITLEDVANHVSLSANYFSNIFKKTTGLSYIEYLTNIRIEKAKTLLMNLNLTIYQIASEVGYNDSRYFSRVFKSFIGKTPSEYRNSLLVSSDSMSMEKASI